MLSVTPAAPSPLMSIADIQDACEVAVRLAPEDGYIRDSRGLNRALNNDFAGASDDFQAFLAWAQSQTEALKTEEFLATIPRREAWIATLEAGENPFDSATLEELRDE